MGHALRPPPPPSRRRPPPAAAPPNKNTGPRSLGPPAAATRGVCCLTPRNEDAPQTKIVQGRCGEMWGEMDLDGGGLLEAGEAKVCARGRGRT